MEERPTPRRKRTEGMADLEELKERFQSGLYYMLMEAGTLQGLRDLLKCQDKVLRQKAWELALKHAIPILKESEEGGGKVIVNMNIPRPPVNVTPGGQNR